MTRYCRWCGEDLPGKYLTYCPGVGCIIAARHDVRQRKAAGEPLEANELYRLDKLYAARVEVDPDLKLACKEPGCTKPRHLSSPRCRHHQVERKRAYHRTWVAQRRMEVKGIRRCVFCNVRLTGCQRVVCAKHRDWKARLREKAYRTKRRERAAAEARP